MSDKTVNRQMPDSLEVPFGSDCVPRRIHIYMCVKIGFVTLCPQTNKLVFSLIFRPYLSNHLLHLFNEYLRHNTYLGNVVVESDI